MSELKSLCRLGFGARGEKISTGFAMFQLFILPALANAETTLCVEVRADDTQLENLQRLAENEVTRHPGYLVVGEGCGATLLVELFDVGGATFLTIRLDRGVPLRYTIEEPRELDEKLTEGVSLVLQNDPVRLSEDVTHYSELERAAHSVLVRGHFTWRIELFEVTGRSGTGAEFVPGGAIAMTRGADNWLVFARIYFGGSPEGVTISDHILRFYTGGDVGVTYEFSADSATTFYLSAGVGLQFLSYEGSTTVDGRELDQTIETRQIGLTVSARAGVRFLRIYDFDVDLFACGYLPLFNTHDPDSELMDHYTPSLQIGMGVGF